MDYFHKGSNKVLIAENGKKHFNLINQIVLCVIFIISYLYIFDVKFDLNGDNFEYLNLAKSIIEGKGYSFPYAPNSIPTNWFPPGYSSILALEMFVFGNNIIAFKVINGLFFLGSILLLYNISRLVITNIQLAFSICVLLLLNSGLLRFSTIIMSEMSYLFFSMLTFFCVIKLKNEVVVWKSKYFYGIILFSVAAFYIRSIGIVLPVAIALHWLFEKRGKQVLWYLTGFITLYLPWFIRNSLLDIKSRYLDTIMTVNAWRPEQGHITSVTYFMGKMAINFYDTVIKGFTEVLFPFIKLNETPVTTVIIVGVIILTVTFIGAWTTKNYKYLFIFYVLGNILILMVWHGGNFSRYVWPLAPFIALCFFNGLFYLSNLILKKVLKKTIQLIPYSFLLLSLFFINGLKEIHEMAFEKEYYPAYKNYFEMAKQIKKLENTQLLVACRKPGMFYYFANCYVTNYKDSESDREIMTDFIDKKVDYLVLEKLGYSSVYRYLRPAVEKNIELFNVVYYLENPNTFLLKFDIEKAKKKFNYGIVP